MILECRELCFAYRTLRVLDRIDLRIEPGVTAIIGPNATGKSTLLKCLCGLLSPRGQVLLDGRSLQSFDATERSKLISYLPQDLSAGPVLTVFEMVLLGRVHELGWRVSPRDIDAVEELLDELGLGGLGGRYVGELSGGQRQMVAIAQALAREPRVLLLDEPTSSLDLQHQFEICALLTKLTASRGMTTAIAVHDLNVAARFADVVCVLKDGSVHLSGMPAEVLTQSMIASVYRVAANVAMAPDGRPLVTPLGLVGGEVGSAAGLSP
ncbi:MAG: ABC transporter ATP-binding protein [Planctomycetota bacterium]